MHAKKIAAIEALKAEVGGDTELTAAYDSKIAKENGGAGFMLDADRMREAHRAMDAHVGKLEEQLASQGGPGSSAAGSPWRTSCGRSACFG